MRTQDTVETFARVFQELQYISLNHVQSGGFGFRYRHGVSIYTNRLNAGVLKQLQEKTGTAPKIENLFAVIEKRYKCCQVLLYLCGISQGINVMSVVDRKS